MGSTKTQETKLPQWQEDFIRENILPKGLDIANTEYTPYEGELIAGMTPLQTEALSNFGSLGVTGDQYGKALATQDELTSFAAPQLSSTNLDAYMNPYTQNVIDQGQMDIERQRQMASNTLGAEATRRGAFGGSRQGVAEGVLAGEAARAAADLSATQRQKAYDQAISAAKFDVGSQFTGAGVRAGAANQLAGTVLGGLGAQLTSGEQMRLIDQARLGADYSMFKEEQRYPLSQLNALLSAGSGIPTGLGTVTQHDPFGGLTAVGSVLSGVGAVGSGGGLSGFWGGSDTRLKENIKPVGKVGEFNFYTWDWNEDGEKVAKPDQPTFGVMAQEVEKTHPELVMIGADGFRRVNYGELYKQIGQ